MLSHISFFSVIESNPLFHWIKEQPSQKLSQRTFQWGQQMDSSIASGRHSHSAELQSGFLACLSLSFELLRWDSLFAGEHSSPLRNHQWQRRNQISRASSHDCRRHSSQSNQPGASPGTPLLFFAAGACRLSSLSQSFRPLLTLTLRAGETEIAFFFLHHLATFTKIMIIAWYLKSGEYFCLEKGAIWCRLCWMRAIRASHLDVWFISGMTSALAFEGAPCLSQSPNYLHPAERGQREPLCVGPINYMV